jgi:hypothetical protein
MGGKAERRKGGKAAKIQIAEGFMRWFFMLLMFPVLLQGQEYRVTGKVIDAKSGEPLIAANVIVRYFIGGSDSSRFAGAATNADGEFVIRLRTRTAPDTMQITTSLIDYNKFVITRTSAAETGVLDIGELRLTHDALWKPFIRPAWSPGWKYNWWNGFKDSNFRSIVIHEEIMALPVR